MYNSHKFLKNMNLRGLKAIGKFRQYHLLAHLSVVIFGCCLYNKAVLRAKLIRRSFMDVNLIMFKKDGASRSIPLPSNVTVIGRRHDCDLRIPLVSVSRRHCQLNYDKGALKIRDLGSRNGIILNGKRVEEAVIKPGDSIEIGPLRFLLQINGRPENIVPSESAAQKLGRPGKPKDELFDNFADLDESDSLGATGTS